MKLRKLREQRNLSQLEIANELDISQSAYNK
ncbi:helix-turn-helix domain-containing protein [Chryseobacterium piscicola]